MAVWRAHSSLTEGWGLCTVSLDLLQLFGHLYTFQSSAMDLLPLEIKEVKSEINVPKSCRQGKMPSQSITGQRGYLPLSGGPQLSRALIFRNFLGCFLKSEAHHLLGCLWLSWQDQLLFNSIWYRICFKSYFWLSELKEGIAKYQIRK